MQEKFTAPDISCDHCKHAIEQALRPVSGVRSAEVDVASKSVVVDYDPAAVSRDDLARILEEEGYPIS